MKDTKFKPGQSGNPKGRAAGTTPGAKLRKAIELRADDILQAVIDAGVNGDMQAAKVLLDRVCPTLKPQAMPITVPIAGGLAQQGDEIIKATMGGQIPPDIGGQLITALAAQGKLVELQEMQERLKRIEKQLESRQ